MERYKYPHSTYENFRSSGVSINTPHLDTRRAYPIAKTDPYDPSVKPVETAMSPLNHSSGRVKKLFRSAALVAGLTGLVAGLEVAEVTTAAPAAAWICGQPPKLADNLPNYEKQCGQVDLSTKATIDANTPSAQSGSSSGSASAFSDDKVIENRWCGPKGLDPEPIHGNAADKAEYARAKELCGSGSQASASAPQETTSTQPYVEAPPITTTTIPPTPTSFVPIPPAPPHQYRKPWDGRIKDWSKKLDAQRCFEKGNIYITAVGAGDSCSDPVADMVDKAWGFSSPFESAAKFLSDQLKRNMPLVGLFTSRVTSNQELYLSRRRIDNNCPGSVNLKPDPTTGIGDPTLNIPRVWECIENDVWTEHGK